MSDTSLKHRLAAILAADAAGYSRLMAGDDRATVVALAAARAMRCADAVVRGLQALGITIRAGLHTGEVEALGDKVSGMAVHIGARVMSMAGSGEVWVSGTTRDLVAGSGIGFEARGAHALKGVPGEWTLHRALVPVEG